MKLLKMRIGIIWFTLFLFIVQLIWVDFIFASPTEGTIDPTYKYAWSEKAGWINFGCSNCNVRITDSNITGYAWNENYGWINLAPSTSGVRNDGEGNLSGYAWGENLGWINFSGVVINSSGEFTGMASGDISGRINFNCSNCKVKTDWRPRSARNQEIGGVVLLCNPPVPPPDGFSIFINNDASETNSQNVNLTLRAGPDTVKMAISNFPDFQEAGQEAYQKTKTWVLTEGEGAKTVYVKFYSQCGASSKVVSDSIVYKKPIIEILEIIKKVPEIIKKIPEIIKPKPAEEIKSPPEEIKSPEVPVEGFLPEKEKPKIVELKPKYCKYWWIDWRIIFLLLALIILIIYWWIDLIDCIDWRIIFLLLALLLLALIILIIYWWIDLIDCIDWRIIFLLLALIILIIILLLYKRKRKEKEKKG